MGITVECADGTERFSLSRPLAVETCDGSDVGMEGSGCATSASSSVENTISGLQRLVREHNVGAARERERLSALRRQVWGVMKRSEACICLLAVDELSRSKEEEDDNINEFASPDCGGAQPYLCHASIQNPKNMSDGFSRPLRRAADRRERILVSVAKGEEPARVSPVYASSPPPPPSAVVANPPALILLIRWQQSLPRCAHSPQNK